VSSALRWRSPYRLSAGIVDPVSVESQHRSRRDQQALPPAEDALGQLRTRLLLTFS
jgi:hypothetical protein